MPFARDGMYYKEFHVMFDWLHLGEGLSVFNLEGLCDPRDSRYPAAGRALRGVLPERRSRRAELRSQGQDHPQPVQRQPRPPAPQGDGPRLGRRPHRGRGPVPARTRRAQLRPDARAFPGLQRHRRRSPLNLGATDARAQRLHADPRGTLQELDPRLRRRLARSGCSTTAGSSRPISASTARSAAPAAASGTAACTAGDSRVDQSGHRAGP